MPKAEKWFWLRDANRRPVAVVYTHSVPLREIIHFSVATHNPSDKFDKQRGLEIAKGRMAVQHYETVVCTNPAKPVKVQVLNKVAHGNYPQKTKEAARLWLASLQEKQENA